MYNVEIIVSSDSCFRGEREDLSGIKIKEIVEKIEGFNVKNISIFPDEQMMLAKKMSVLSDASVDSNEEDKVHLILTTGGTGFSPRDVMPEATLEVIEKEVPGIPEAMRYESLKITSRAMLSRARAGIRKGTLIINLPGSPKAIEEMLTYIMPSVLHGLDILNGNAKNCARK